MLEWFFWRQLHELLVVLDTKQLEGGSLSLISFPVSSSSKKSFQSKQRVSSNLNSGQNQYHGSRKSSSDGKEIKLSFKIAIWSELLLVLWVDFLRVIIHDCHPATVLTPDQRWLMAGSWPLCPDIMKMNITSWVLAVEIGRFFCGWCTGSLGLASAKEISPPLSNQLAPAKGCFDLFHLLRFQTLSPEKKKHLKTNNPNQFSWSPFFSIYPRPQIIRNETAAVSFRVLFSWLRRFLRVFVLILYGLEYMGQMNAATSVPAQLGPISASPIALFTFSIN